MSTRWIPVSWSRYNMRMNELKQIAEELGADLVQLKRGPKH